MKSSFFSALPLTLLCTIASAAANSGAPSTTSVVHPLDPYSQEILSGDVASYSIEGVSIASANLQVTQTSESNCGASETGYQGCMQNSYISEPAVEVRVLLNSPVASSEQPSASQWKTYFRLSDFSKDEIRAIQQTGANFDSFGSSTVRSRELARRLFAAELGLTTLLWNEPVFGNNCTTSSSGGEITTTQCNVIGQRSRSQIRETIKILRR